METSAEIRQMSLDVLANKLEPHTLSQLELLPRELIFNIIDYIPKSVHSLMLTSRQLHKCVCEYALGPVTIPLVDVFSLASSRTMLGEAIITINIPLQKSHLFELRLKHRKSQTKLIMRRSWDTDSANYQCQLNVLDLNEEVLLEYLRQCIGNRIGKVELVKCNDWMLPLLPKLFKGVIFQRLEIIAEIVSEDMVRILRSFISDHKVDKLLLSARSVACSDTVGLLINISTLVRSLCLVQKLVFGRDRSKHYFLGVYGADWAQIIVDMFSRKLDKLCISNHSCPEYLTKSCANVLRERLPKLGKTLWFEATCNKYETGLNYMSGEHSVQADRIGVHGNSLRIKHSTREDEIFDWT